MIRPNLPPPARCTIADFQPQTVVVWGEMCSWWDYAERAASRPVTGASHPMPCCPYCHSLLFQMPAAEWRVKIDAHALKEPNYHALIDWMQGKCYPSFRFASDVYAHEQEILGRYRK